MYILRDLFIIFINGQPSTNNTTGFIEENAQRKQKKSCDVSYNNIIVIWRSNKLCFWKNLKKVLNLLNSAS